MSPKSPYNLIWYLNFYFSNFTNLSPLDLIMSHRTCSSKLRCSVHENFSLQFSVQTYKNFMEVFKSSCESWKTFQPNQMTLPFLQCKVETVQDFLIKLGIKPLMHLLKISIFSLNNDIIRLTKIMNNPVKNLKILRFKVIIECLKSVKYFQK